MTPNTEEEEDQEEEVVVGGVVGVTNRAWNEVNAERDHSREGVLRRCKIR